MPIRDGKVNFNGQTLEEVTAWLYAGIAKRYGVTVPPLSEMAGVAPIPAIVNHGRWLVACPDCAGAEFVWPETPQMMCCNCWNAKVGGKWRPVALPKDRAEIEAVLVRRVLPQERNWTAETVAELKAENVERGDAVPLEVD